MKPKVNTCTLGRFPWSLVFPLFACVMWMSRKVSNPKSLVSSVGVLLLKGTQVESAQHLNVPFFITINTLRGKPVSTGFSLATAG